MLVVRASNSTWARRYLVSKLSQFREFRDGCNSRINRDCLKKCLRISGRAPGMSLKVLDSLQNTSWSFVWIQGKRKYAREDNPINRLPKKMKNAKSLVKYSEGYVHQSGNEIWDVHKRCFFSRASGNRHGPVYSRNHRPIVWFVCRNTQILILSPHFASGARFSRLG